MNKDENFDYDVVRILTGIEYMDGKNVKPITYAYWKNRAAKNDFLWCNCSNCNFIIENYRAISEFGKTNSEYIKVRYKFCPECGAIMFATKELMDNAKM